MRKNKWLLTLGGISAAVLPITAIAASCGTTQKASTTGTTVKTDAELTKEAFGKLNDTQKVQVLKELKLNTVLTQDQIHELINDFNKDAGTFGSIVWYVKSVEALIAKEAAYKNAIVAFDKLKESNKETFDFSQNFNDAQKVDNVASGKSIPAIFMDIDETVLQNDLTESKAMLEGGYTGDKKEEEDLKGRRFAVPGAVEFINHVQANGGLVFYNSDMNQSTAVRNAVKSNLKKLGIKYVADFQFWMRGAMPYLATDEAAISDEATKNKPDAELKTLASSLSFTQNFRQTPWITWTNSKAAYRLGSKVYKTDRMNGLDANTSGWNLGQADNNASGNAVVLKTMMRIGDNFNDFFDRASKSKSNAERVALYRNTEKFADLFTVNGGDGLKYDENTKKLVKLGYKQAYVMVPGNAEYGGWNEPYKYGQIGEFYKAIKEIVNDPRYQTGPTEQQPTLE
ncbi:HAD family acid phosphatase [Mycoplasma nasistruthionis]|uniref:5'-nucleotidase, lipoprotein e(P4) family n=1 Tax=Mycoplasma nasistruthionis TaxID=353852 RepID=A0A5B7XV26_9MOLU|nr:HAD family acid phosphatase [Mycoplasma nasistruthionis]QCZ36791.1 hypothetical protein FG904_02090 [Mycoplasma nasistruthionis]